MSSFTLIHARSIERKEGEFATLSLSLCPQFRRAITRNRSASSESANSGNGPGARGHGGRKRQEGEGERLEEPREISLGNRRWPGGGLPSFVLKLLKTRRVDR
mgnify:CR=1 FL=1